jgi:hypothetical protein
MNLKFSIVDEQELLLLNIGWNIESILTIASFVVTVGACYFVLRVNWKRYGALFLLSAVVGVALCYVFIYLDLYSFPYRLFPGISKIPFTLILTIFPLYVLLGVRYSPKSWMFKVPFYWGLVHIGVLTEAWAEKSTQLIKYNPHWQLWESYTWWWIFLLVFEFAGGMLIPDNFRKPLDQELLRYGRLGWFILHFVLIVTIFLAGVDAGKTLLK